MPVSRIKSKEKEQWVKPTKLEEAEFLDAISEAEKGPFKTVKESVENFENWLEKREKK
jgi:hypothetical protein